MGEDKSWMQRLRRVGSLLLGFAMGGLLFGLPGGAAEPPRLERFWDRVEALVKEHYPSATVSRTARTLTVSHETRTFMVHLPLKTGEWQEASPMDGPKRRGGILGTIELAEGRWGGAAVVPQSFDRAYFTEYLTAPYSQRCECHLVAHLYYPDTVNRAFVDAWTALINDFDAHLE